MEIFIYLFKYLHSKTETRRYLQVYGLRYGIIVRYNKVVQCNDILNCYTLWIYVYWKKYLKWFYSNDAVRRKVATFCVKCTVRLIPNIQSYKSYTSGNFFASQCLIRTLPLTVSLVVSAT